MGNCCSFREKDSMAIDIMKTPKQRTLLSTPEAELCDQVHELKQSVCQYHNIIYLRSEDGTNMDACKPVIVDDYDDTDSYR